MAGIINYVAWRGDLSFEASPFNPVDNLILSRLSYINFDDLEKDGESIGSVASRYVDSSEKMKLGIFVTGKTKPLFQAVGNSERFKSLILKDYVSIINEKVELQFSAITIELNEETAYIAFRGTDDTLVGWKEDFNMTFMDEVPAQLEALAYLEKVVGKHNYKKIYIGGHSKGGNLAVYSAVYLNEDFKQRISAVFNNDGPGFKNTLLTTPQYKEIENRIITLIPQSSVVGLLLEHEEKFRVIKCRQPGIMQHDGFSWEVLGNDFVYLPKLDEDAQIFDITMKKTLEKMSPDQKEAFSNVLFEVLTVNESKTLTDLSGGGLGNFFKMTNNYNNLDEITKKAISDTLSLFFDEGYQSFLEVTELNQWRTKLKTWNEETKNEMKAFIKRL